MVYMLNVVMSIFTKIVFEPSQIEHYYFRVIQSGQSSSCSHVLIVMGGETDMFLSTCI
jgi:hypothetical protein